MKNDMRIEEIRRIPIDKLLYHLGHIPVSRTRGGTQLMYRSPFRDETKPSFAVNTVKNVWNDFGMGKGGNVIDLTMAWNSNCSFHEAVIWLQGKYQELRNMTLAISSEKSDFDSSTLDKSGVTSDVRVIPLAHKALIGYLAKRGIRENIGKQYCKEVHYSIHGKEYFGICFMNILGGMEIRNAYYKGCYGVKAPSIIPVNKTSRTGSCCVFEGFMDFLSYKVFEIIEEKNVVINESCDCIVLNSTSEIHKTLNIVGEYNKIICYLDNDIAGEKAKEEIIKSYKDRCINKSMIYQQHVDLNDYLISNIRRL